MQDQWGSMGCDIHEYIEQKIDGVWQRVPESKGPLDYMAKYGEQYNRSQWSIPRNYMFFGMLAGVRNESIAPILLARGIPEDASQGVVDDWDRWSGDGHTPSYYTLAELLDAQNKQSILTGFLDIKQYKQFKVSGNPEDWYTFVPSFKNDVVIVSNEEMDRIINLLAFWDGVEYYTECVWEYPNKLICPHFWESFVPAMQKLDPNPNNVRFVFWFDN